jgi:hypothetical protein
MRKVLLSCALILAQAGLLMAEPLVLEQAGNVLKPKTLEVGSSDISYQADETKLTDDAGTVVTTVKRTSFVIPVTARYAFTSKIEGLLMLPYNMVGSKSEPAGGSSTSDSEAGLGDPTLLGKCSFAYKGWDLAAAAAFAIPMGKESEDFPDNFRQGFNVKPLVAARKGFGKVVMNGNLSYNMAGEYTDANDVKRKPGDVLSLGLGGEFVCPKTGINWIGEFIYGSLSDSAIDGVTQSGSSGSRMDLVLGGRYNTGNWKTKLGLDLSLGEEKYREYDYKIIAGVTYLIKI